MEREILLLGNPALYEISEEVKEEELVRLHPRDPEGLRLWAGHRRAPDWHKEAADLHVDGSAPRDHKSDP